MQTRSRYRVFTDWLLQLGSIILLAGAGLASHALILPSFGSGTSVFAAFDGGIICINNWQYVQVAPGVYTATGVRCGVASGDLRGPERGENEDDYGRVPIILSPRNTALLNLEPTIRWSSVTSTTAASPLEYVLHLSPGSFDDITVTAASLTCEPDTRATPARICSLPWPADRWTLVPGKRYFLTVSASENFGLRVHESESSALRTLDATSAAQVQAQVAAIQAFQLDPTSEDILLADLLLQQGMRANDPRQSLYAEAIERYERVLQTAPTPASYITLGDAYWVTELRRYAYWSYQSALDRLDETDADPALRAAAEFGQGLVEHSWGKFDVAEPHFVRAAALYAQIGARAGRAAAEFALGDIEDKRCNVAQAEAHYRLAAQLYTALGQQPRAQEIEETVAEMSERCQDDNP